MRGRIGDKVRLLHIIEAIDEVDSYCGDSDFNEFQENSMMRFACIKQMEIIGEASNHTSIETKVRFPEVEWAQIIGMRNIFVHEYFGVDTKLVWDIIVNDLPELKLRVEAALAAFE